jgi:hypothetical protein
VLTCCGRYAASTPARTAAASAATRSPAAGAEAATSTLIGANRAAGVTACVSGSSPVRYCLQNSNERVGRAPALQQLRMT